MSHHSRRGILSKGAGGGAASYYLAVAHTNSPYVTVYPWSVSGFGTKFANPATLPTGQGYGVAFSPTGDALAVSTFDNITWSSPLSVYRWSASGFGAKFADPATSPGFIGYNVAFTPSSSAIAVTTYSTPSLHAYAWSASGFGKKFANPAISATVTNSGDVAFSPAGDAIAEATDGSPFIIVYRWSASGFGTKFADPATLPNAATSVAFSPAGDAIAVTHSYAPYVTAYPWSASGFGTKFSDPTTLPAGSGIAVAFSPAGDAIAVAHSSAPYVTAYPWSASGFGTKFANPATLPAGGNPVKVAFGAITS